MSRAVCSRRVAREMEVLENISAEAQESQAAAIAGSSECIRNGLIDPARRLSHDHDAIAHVNRFVDIVGDEKHGGATVFPEAQHLILHTHPGKSIKRAERLVEQENLRVVNERSGKSNALGHAPGEMVRVSVAKCFQPHESHQFVHLISFLTQHPTRDKTGLDVAANAKPGKQIWILKNQAAFRTWFADWFRTDQNL